MSTETLKGLIREVPNFPKPGINFYDVTTLFRDAAGLRSALDQLAEPYRGQRLTAIAGIEARGFVLAAALAQTLDTGLILIRKRGKLPAKTIGESYSLEYGEAHLEIHHDAATGDDRVLVVDDVLATGGTAQASGRLIERLGAEVAGYAFLIELAFLSGRQALGQAEIFSLLSYDE